MSCINPFESCCVNIFNLVSCNFRIKMCHRDWNWEVRLKERTTNELHNVAMLDETHCAKEIKRNNNKIV